MILHHFVIYLSNDPRIILSNVATFKNCTITQQQHYFKTVRRSRSLLVWNSVSFVSDDCLQSVRHRTDEMRFCTVVEEIDLQDFRRRCSSAVNVCGSGLDKQLLQTFSIGDKSGKFGGQCPDGM